MAYVNVTMSELINLIKMNEGYDQSRVKDIRLVNGSSIQLTISVGQFFPDIKVVLVFSKFESGRMYFNLQSGGAIKMVMGLINEFANKDGNNYLSIQGNFVIVDMNKIITNNMKGLQIKDMSLTGEQIYITMAVG